MALNQNLANIKKLCISQFHLRANAPQFPVGGRGGGGAGGWAQVELTDSLSPFKTSRCDYFSKSRKLSTNWCRFKERNRATTFFSFVLNISNTSRLE